VQAGSKSRKAPTQSRNADVGFLEAEVTTAFVSIRAKSNRGGLRSRLEAHGKSGNAFSGAVE
jgi:hypothetical protein